MMNAVTSALASLITMLGSVVSAVVTESGALSDLLPLFAIGVACSVIAFGVKCIKLFTWGA